MDTGLLNAGGENTYMVEMYFDSDFYFSLSLSHRGKGDVDSVRSNKIWKFSSKRKQKRFVSRNLFFNLQ